MGSSTWNELTSTLASYGGAYVRGRNAFVTNRPELVGIIAARGLRLHGRRLPLSWTSDDLRSEASISLLTLIDALRLHGTSLPAGWRRHQLGSAQLLERLDGKPYPVIDPRVLRPDRVEAFLVQWAAPATRQSLDDDEFDVSGRRRELRLRKTMSDLSESRASLVSADEAAEWANARNAETYGIAAATQDRAALAIARSTDLEPTDEMERESISAEVRDRVASAVPAAIADRRVVAEINRRTVAEHGLARAAESGLLVRPADLIGSREGVTIREAESAAIRTRLLDWSRRNPCKTSLSAAVSYTIAHVVEIGTRRLKRSGIHLTSADLQPTYPQLIGPETNGIPHQSRWLTRSLTCTSVYSATRFWPTLRASCPGLAFSWLTN